MDIKNDILVKVTKVNVRRNLFPLSLNLVKINTDVREICNNIKNGNCQVHPRSRS